MDSHPEKLEVLFLLPHVANESNHRATIFSSSSAPDGFPVSMGGSPMGTPLARSSRLIRGPMKFFLPSTIHWIEEIIRTIPNATMQ
jgi:hypothetical protein